MYNKIITRTFRKKIPSKITVKNKIMPFSSGKIMQNFHESWNYKGSPSVQHISSTQKGHSFSALKIPEFYTKNPTVQHTPQFHTKNPRVQHTPQFHTKNPQVPHLKPLSSTPKTPQFHTKNPLSSKHPSDEK